MPKLSVSLIGAIIAGVLSVFMTFAMVSHRIGWDQLVAPIVMALVYSIILWTAFYLVPLTRKVSGTVTAVVVVLTMTWMDYPVQVIPVGIILLLFMFAVKSKNRVKDKIDGITTGFGAIALSLLVVWSVVGSLVSTGGTEIGKDADANLGETVNSGETLPNIYLIIPDRLTSIEGLREFGVDTGEYEETLTGYGFYLRPDQLSIDEITPDSKPVPTTRTFRFMSSILNGGIDIPLDISYNQASRLVKQASMFGAMIDMGYEIHNVGSWYTETQMFSQATQNYVTNSYGLGGFLYNSEFGMAVLDRSILRYFNISPALPGKMHTEIRRNEHLFQKNTIADIADKTINNSNSVFVMAHLMLPHIPFVWSANGSYPESGLNVRELYREQAQFTLMYLVEVVEKILSSDPDAVILIQSDEGCLFHNKPDNAGLSENQWNGQMVAWRIPGVEDGEMDRIQPIGLLNEVINKQTDLSLIHEVR